MELRQAHGGCDRPGCDGNQPHFGLAAANDFPYRFVDGEQQAVALFAVDTVNGQQQINFQLPWEVAVGTNATIVVSNGGAEGASLSVPVIAALDFQLQRWWEHLRRDSTRKLRAGQHRESSKTGETVLIYCTGLGAVESPPEDGAAGNGQHTMSMPEVTIAETKAIVSVSGLAPGFVGLYQIKVEVPAGLKAGNQPVVVDAGQVASNSVLLPVQ